MSQWPNSRLIDLLGTEHPIVQAPMAGANDSALAIAVSRAGGLGSLPTAMPSPDGIRAEVALIKAASDRAYNLNFFALTPSAPDPAANLHWIERLAPYYDEFGIDPPDPEAAGPPPPGFDDASVELVEELKPPVVSFHFGLPEPRLLEAVKATGAIVISSATSAREAEWLEEHGADAIIAQGAEAGGHRGSFLETDPTTQAGTFALVPQVVDAVSVPVIAAGGISDARGIAAAFVLGADGVQAGTAYLFTHEARISSLHRAALLEAKDHSTALTNVFSGRPARSIVNRLVREAGPLSTDTPPFPLAGAALGPLRAAAEAQGSPDFGSLWSGQAAALIPETDIDAEGLTLALAEGALERLEGVTLD